MRDGFVLVAGNPVPTGATEGHLQVAPGVVLRYGIFAPEGPVRGTVCFLQGRGECIERNFETIRDLAARGFQVATFDWRGQGGSPEATRTPRYGHCSNFDKYIGDFTRFMQEIVLPDCPPPYVMLGNSMGGHIGLRLIARYNWFEAAVMVAPFIDVPMSRMPRWMKSTIVHAMARLGLGRLKLPFHSGRLPVPEGFENNPLTGDKTRFLRNARLWQEAPGLAASAPTVGWAAAALRSCAKLQALDDTSPLRCPALLVIAGGEKVVSNEAIQQFARFVPGAASVTINGSKHDILCEREAFRDQFFAAFDAFVADHVRKS